MERKGIKDTEIPTITGMGYTGHTAERTHTHFPLGRLLFTFHSYFLVPAAPHTTPGYSWRHRCPWVLRNPANKQGKRNNLTSCKISKPHGCLRVDRSVRVKVMLALSSFLLFFSYFLLVYMCIFYFFVFFGCPYSLGNSGNKERSGIMSPFVKSQILVFG